MLKTNVLKIDNLSKRNIFWILTAVLVSLLGLYICFITQTIVNTSSYKIIEQKIATLDSDVGELEFKYISLKKDINFNLAKELGYTETSNVKFVDKSTANQVLSLSL